MSLGAGETLSVHSKNSEGYLVGLKQLCDLGQITHHWKDRIKQSIDSIRLLLRMNEIMHVTSLAA